MITFLATNQRPTAQLSNFRTSYREAAQMAVEGQEGSADKALYRGLRKPSAMLPVLQDKKDAKILVVDDSPTNRALLRSILKAGGYQVLEAEDGKQCLEVCAREVPSVILLDIMMPVVDGLTACRKIRQDFNKAELPIIMVTTVSESEGLAESLNAGANDYITKPIERTSLLARMENQLSLAKAQQRIVEQTAALEKALKVQQATGDILPEAVVVHDFKGNIIYCNRTCLRFCQEREPASMAELCELIFGGKFKDAMLDCVGTTLASAEIEISRELLHSQAPFHTVSLLTRPIAIEQGVLRLWVWWDNTERTELERSVSQRIKLETVGSFAAGVAHNFNNIMCAMLGATEVLDRINQNNETAQRCVQLIKKAIDGGQRLTRKMSAAYGEELVLKLDENENLPAVLRDLVDCYAQSVDGTVKFEMDVPADLPGVIVPGTVLLEIMGNILSNAIESIEGKGSVFINARVPPSSSSVRIEVRDTGRGMTEEELGKIFEPFYSTKNFDKLSGVAVEGRGLGMWNTYNLICSYRGTLLVESTRGVGTTVTLTLPTVS